MAEINTAEEIIADFGDDEKGAIKYYELSHGVSHSEAKQAIQSANRQEVERIITQNRIEHLSSCPMCHGTNISISRETHVESESRSFLWNVFMSIITASLWLIWMLVRKKKETVVETKHAICQKCGYSWIVEE